MPKLPSPVETEREAARLPRGLSPIFPQRSHFLSDEVTVVATSERQEAAAALPVRGKTATPNPPAAASGGREGPA